MTQKGEKGSSRGGKSTLTGGNSSISGKKGSGGSHHAKGELSVKGMLPEFKGKEAVGSFKE